MYKLTFQPSNDKTDPGKQECINMKTLSSRVQGEKVTKDKNRTPNLLRKNICILALHLGQITTAPVTMPNPYRSTVAQLDIFRLAEVHPRSGHEVLDRE